MLRWTRSLGWLWVMVGLGGVLLGCTAPTPVMPAPVPTPTFDLAANRFPDPVSAPFVTLTAFSAEPIHPLNPGVFRYQIGGRYLAQAAFHVTQTRADGATVLVYRDAVADPLLPDGILRDGVYEGRVVWDGTAYTLAGQPVLWRRDDAGRDAVAGAVSWPDGSTTPGAALFDASTGDLLAWQLDGADSAPLDGATFAPAVTLVDDDGKMRQEPGVSAPVGDLRLVRQPLPPGSVDAGFSAETHTGAIARDTHPITIGANTASGETLYFDADRGFQFQLPGEWPAPADANGVVAATNSASATRLQIQLVDDPPAAPLADVILNTWQGVSVLYEDETTVAGAPATRTYYGYTDVAGGDRVGVLLTFFMGDTGVVLDVDGPAAGQDATVALVESIAATWRLRPVDVRDATARWTREDAGWLPVGFEMRRTDAGWTRYARPEQGAVFFAHREDPASGSSEQAVLAQWRRSAAAGHSTFVAGEPQRVAYDARPWTRLSFVAGEGTQGSLWVSVADSAETVLWIEAPSAQFAALEELALVTLAANR